VSKVDDVVAAYIKLRDKKTEMERKHKEELAPIKETMSKLENWLQRRLLEEGVESFKTSQGTAFLQSATSATVRDWDATFAWMQKNDEWSLLEARVNKTAVRDFVETNGEAPPGVEYSETIVTRVRR
jgi:hypothetical protein